MTLTIQHSGVNFTYRTILYISGVMILNIVKAIRDDSGDIMELIKSCILNMESLGIYQWNEYYPTLDIIIGDVESGSMYVLKEGNSIWGIIAINEDQSPEYNNLSWVCNEGKALVVHRLAVQPKKQRTGVNALFAGHNPKNTASAQLLKRLGFTYKQDEFYPPTGLYHPSYLMTKQDYKTKQKEK